MRHGTTTLFAALDVGTGEVTAACREQHRAVEFLGFLDMVEEKYRGRETHVVLDNFSTHSTAAVKEWLADLYRAVDQFGQVIDVLLSPKRDKKAAQRFFTRALAGAIAPAEVTTDRAAAYPRVLASWCPPPSTSRCPTRTTGSRPTTAGSRPGYKPRAGSRQTDRCGSSPPGTRSCRTCGAATTNLRPRPRSRIAW